MIDELAEELNKLPPMHPEYTFKIAEMSPDELFVEIVNWYHKCEKLSTILIAISALIEEQGLADAEELKRIYERTHS
jgi:hypothetical protein